MFLRIFFRNKLTLNPNQRSLSLYRMVVNAENSQELVPNFKQVNSQSTRGSEDIDERMEGKYRLEDREKGS